MPRDADAGWDRREGGGAVPLGVEDLAAVGADLAAGPVGEEADHERVGEGPRLAAEVPNVRDLDADLFAHLAGDRLLERLADFDEARERAVKDAREARA